MKVEIYKCDLCGNDKQEIYSLDVFTLGSFDICKPCYEILLYTTTKDNYWTNEFKNTLRKLGEFASHIVVKQCEAKRKE